MKKPKSITKERIIKTLDRIDKAAEKRLENFTVAYCSWDASMRFTYKKFRVLDIQSRYGVSGLVGGATRLGDKVLAHPVQDSGLLLTDSDIQILSQNKLKVLQFWFDYCILNGLKFYKDADSSWKKMRMLLQQIRSYLHLFQWARIEEEVREDKEYREIRLILCRGRSMNDPDYCVSFCGSNRVHL
jgi:hypothetical protein